MHIFKGKQNDLQQKDLNGKLRLRLAETKKQNAVLSKDLKFQEVKSQQMTNVLESLETSETHEILLDKALQLAEVSTEVDHLRSKCRQMQQERKEEKKKLIGLRAIVRSLQLLTHEEVHDDLEEEFMEDDDLDSVRLDAEKAVDMTLRYLKLRVEHLEEQQTTMAQEVEARDRHIENLEKENGLLKAKVDMLGELFGRPSSRVDVYSSMDLSDRNSNSNSNRRREGLRKALSDPTLDISEDNEQYELHNVQYELRRAKKGFRKQLMESSSSKPPSNNIAIKAVKTAAKPANALLVKPANALFVKPAKEVLSSSFRMAKESLPKRGGLRSNLKTDGLSKSDHTSPRQRSLISPRPDRTLNRFDHSYRNQNRSDHSYKSAPLCDIDYTDDDDDDDDSVATFEDCESCGSVASGRSSKSGSSFASFRKMGKGTKSIMRTMGGGTPRTKKGTIDSNIGNSSWSHFDQRKKFLLVMGSPSRSFSSPSKNSRPHLTNKSNSLKSLKSETLTHLLRKELDALDKEFGPSDL